MLGFPSSTEIKKTIPKKKVFEHFGAEMSAERRKSLDADIARITLVNEVSPVSVNITVGSDVQVFFVLHILLRRRDYDRQNIALIARMFGQKLLIVLEYEGKQQLAIWQTRLILGDWLEPENLRVELTGLDMDKVWENIVAGAAGVALQQGRTLDEQLARQQKRQKMERDIARLEKQAWAEKHPKRKMELAQTIKKLKEEAESI